MNNDSTYKLLCNDIKNIVKEEDKQNQLISQLDLLLAEIRQRHESSYSQMVSDNRRLQNKIDILIESIDDNLEEFDKVKIYEDVINNL